MRKVVDTNFLQTEALRAYLAASTDNYVVLTEFAAMESYKQGALDALSDQMGVLVQFPTQVIVLKGTLDVCSLSGRDAVTWERMIDETQTGEFPVFCQHLLAAKRGDLSIRGQLSRMDAKQEPIWIECFRVRPHFPVELNKCNKPTGRRS
jgi:hypothetical protein